MNGYSALSFDFEKMQELRRVLSASSETLEETIQLSNDAIERLMAGGFDGRAADAAEDAFVTWYSDAVETVDALAYAKACLDEGINRASVLKNTCEMISMAVGAEYAVNPEWTTSGLYVAGEAAMLSNQVRGMIDSDVLGLSYILSDQMDAVQGIPGANQIASAIADAEWLCANFRERAETLYEAYCRMNDRAGFMEETETNTFLKWYLSPAFGAATFREVITDTGIAGGVAAAAESVILRSGSARSEALWALTAKNGQRLYFDEEKQLIRGFVEKGRPDVTVEQVQKFIETGDTPPGHSRHTMQRAKAAMEAKEVLQAAEIKAGRVGSSIGKIGGVVAAATIALDVCYTYDARYDITIAEGYDVSEARSRAAADAALTMALDVGAIVVGEVAVAGIVFLAAVLDVTPVGWALTLAGIGASIAFDVIAVPLLRDSAYEARGW